ncbi:putative non-cytoplasmic protein [Staphylococcus phage 812]|uniref:TreD n=4 Tax=Kayvirus TaxID=1857843 RepID=I6XII8_9CAUD|nr:hypothetical protein [Klebsiella pneumoniae]YP_009041226.1 hypothetical protein CPT_phageK_gp004 [Staphylococcus phage K]YP_009041438.1 hypothetical protein CPT_phageK_gp050 [Staphylococcus phage K]YP_009224414.1 hypothetical protein ST812_004 [Staphylococcus phage 812]YP_009780710.1 TreD [Staphylococcus phage A3R]YP_009780902.1 TreD [Staphylococcus phage A3R]YP_009780922.1 TreD [Staphylococcus phage 676Z]YP_009781134.1 TreD [Staphylococcus phage 676Z]AVZ44701.1 hypothetical protein [Sta
MIEIRLTEDYNDLSLKALLKRIKRVAPRELTYGLEADMDTTDVNIGDSVPSRGLYVEYSERFTRDLWIIVHPSGYDAYYQGEKYGGESLDEIIHDMFYDYADPFDLDY